MPLKILVVGLESRLHGEGFILEKLSEAAGILSRFPGTIVKSRPVSEPIEVPGEIDLLVLLHLTGGTSRLATKIAVSAGKPVLLLAHDKHNSLASSLTARVNLLSSGVKTYHIYYHDKNMLLRKYTAFYQGVNAAEELRKIRIMDINETGSLSEKAELFKNKIGGEIHPYHFEKIWRIGSEAEREELESLKKNVSSYIDLSSTDPGRVEEILRLYYAMRRLAVEKGYTAIVIDCFPLVMKYNITPCIPVAMMNSEGIPTACEGDYHSLILMYLSLALTGRPGWISNPSGYDREGNLRFAHCTIAPVLGENCWAVNHFETGKPYGVVCRYKRRRVVFGRVNKDMTALNIYRGVVKKSGLLAPGYCRTQLLVDTGPLKPEEFIGEAWGNHHVFIPWREDIIDMLRSFSWWMSWDLTINN